VSVPPVSFPPDLRARQLARLRALEPRVRPASELVATARTSRPPDASAAQGLAEALGGRIVERSSGSVVVVERTQRLPIRPHALASLPFAIPPERPLVLLDTETTGLGTAAGTVAFLVGLGRWDGALLTVTQLWLPDQADEGALLDVLAEYVASDSWLVTYNGRAFDWPLITTRYRLARRAPPTLAGHLDLLPVCRALFRHRLPDARLATVESGVAGVSRGSDLPGALIPDRYFGWLRNGSATPLVGVREHNIQDVVSMGQLLVVLADRLADPAGHAVGHPGDLAALGRVYRRRRRPEEALACLETALSLPDPEPRTWGYGGRFDRGRTWLEQGSLLASMGRAAEAAGAFAQAVRCGGSVAVRGWIALAKHREHRLRDAAGALDAACAAEQLVARRRAIGWYDPWAERDLARRLQRLRKRVAAPDPMAQLRQVGHAVEARTLHHQAGRGGGNGELPAA
jgi:uncharacterized protein